MDMSGDLVFQLKASERHALASVGKVYILVAFLDLVSREGRDLTQEERLLLKQMIEQSDNDAATTLWRRAGGPDGLQEFLTRTRLGQVERAEDDSWGSMRASAVDLSVLLVRLYQGRLLDEKRTAIALDHLANIIDSQAWGVGLAREESRLETPRVYLKNGWYPEEDGWIVNSAGIIAGESGEYVLVLLTDAQPTFEAGRQLIGAAVLLLRERLL